MAGNCFWLLLHRALTLKGIDKFRLKHYRIPSAIYMFKVSKKQTRAMCQIYSKFFFFTIRVFFHRHWRFTGQQDNGGDHCLFRSTTSTCSQTFRHLFATLDARWLHVFLEYVLTWEAKWTHRFRDFKPAWKQVLFTWSFISAAFRNNSIFWWAYLGISFRVAYILSSEMKFNLCQNDLIGHTIMGNALSWEMPPKNIFFASYTLIMGTLKGSTDQFLISVPEVKILQRVRMDPICFKGAL